MPYLLIRGDLRRAFLRHYAGQYRHLASSRQLLAEVGQAGRRRVMAAGTMVCAKPAGMAGSGVHADLNRMLLPSDIARFLRLSLQEAESAKRRRAAEAAAEEASSEEDVPLATKRRRLIKAGEAKKVRQPQAAAAAAAAPAEEEESPRQRQPAAAAAARSAGVAAAAPSAIPQPSPQSAPGGERQAEAGEQPESSDVTEDARVAGFEDYGEVQQVMPAVDSAAAARRSAAVDMDRLEDALERLVHLPSRQRRADRRKRLLQAAEVGQEAGAVASCCLLACIVW